MLRLRRGVGLSVKCGPSCVIHRGCPRSVAVAQRLFSTSSPRTEEAEPKNESKEPQNVQELLKSLEASQKSLQKKVKELEREATKRKRAKKKSADSKAESNSSDQNDFKEALDVARKVYGVKGRKKKSATKPSAKSKKSTSKSDEEQAIKASEGSAEGVAQKAGMWTSLRERLQQQSKDPLLEVTPEDLEDPEDLEEEPSVKPSKSTSKKAVKAKKVKTKKKAKQDLEVKSIIPKQLQLTPVLEHEELDVPKLSYGLDRVLFNSGVYTLQDSRSRVFNFDPYLATIMPVEEFDFNALNEYITSSKDSRLRDLSAKHNLKYCGSTSSLTSILSHFHFLLSAWRKPNFQQLSRSLDVEFESFTALTRGPAAAFARLQDGVYAIDADKEYDTANVLSMLGKSMEKLLTLPKEGFEKYRRDRSHQLSDEERNADESYHYTTFGDFMLRSQLDAHDPRLPGTGMFDLKTRAVVSIRMDVSNYEKGVGYEIRNRFGTWESFEREYYDMIRAAFLKYSLQVRMGRMDGIFVAFHNTQRIFGFQYVSLEEMDLALHDTTDRRVGDEEFKASLALLNDALDRATKRFPGQSLRLHVETRPTDPPLTYFFAEPVSEEDIKRTQAAGQASVRKFETEILGLTRKEIEAESAELEEELARVEQEQSEEAEGVPEELQCEEVPDDSTWDDMMAKLDETVENESRGFASIKTAIQEALDQSGLLKGKSEEERNSYINALFEALTADMTEGKPAGDASEENIEKVEEASDELPEHQDSQTSTLSSADDASQGEGFPHQSVETATQDISSEETKPRDDEQAEEPAETPEDPLSDQDGEVEHTSSTQDPSLKDLILRVAEGVDNKPRSLKTFEQVLSELVAQSKEVEIDSRDEAEDAGIEHADLSSQESAEEGESTPEDSSEASALREIMGMYITVRNKVNGQSVVRPKLHDPDFDWQIEYTITDLPEDRAQRIYKQLKNRRKNALTHDPEEKNKQWHQMWRGRLAKKTAEGLKWRESITKSDAGRLVYGAWDKEPIASNPPEDLEPAINEGEEKKE